MCIRDRKNTSYEIFYNALDIVKAKMSNEEKSALEIWKQALDNITPQEMCIRDRCSKVSSGC